MNDSALVSVVLPCFNAQDYVAEALGSLRNQTYENIEIIAIDDGSTDGTLYFLSEAAKQDSRIRIVSRENRGLVASLNEGVYLARGRFLARMDADDISYPSRIARQVECLNAHPTVGLCCTDYNSMVLGFRTFPHPRADVQGDEYKIVHLFHTGIVHPTVMFNLDKIGIAAPLYREKYRHAEDFDLFRRISDRSNVYQLPEKLVAWRINHQSVSRIHAEEMLYAHFTIVEEQLEASGFDVHPALFSRFCRNASDLTEFDLVKTFEKIRTIFLSEKFVGRERVVFESAFDIFLMLFFRVASQRFSTSLVFASAQRVGLSGRLRQKDRLKARLSMGFGDLAVGSLLDTVGIWQQKVKALLYGSDARKQP